ncbi:MAG TPA: hypothetical protein VEV81_14345 [Pyrinomonadaceae bacterium]|nr:hypothetical protein [Pyrinomonadaceae bacterium]
MHNHPPFEKLADLAEGRLNTGESEALQAHTSACSRCAEKLGGLERVVGLMRSDEAENAPEELISRAVNLFRSRAASKEPSLVKRLVAALSFDSFQMSPAYGVRSGQAQARQLLYTAGNYDLDLRVTQAGEAWNLSGQVLGEECPGGHIEITGESATVRADLNEQCEFSLSSLPAGNYQLRLRWKELEVEIPRLELKA